MMLQLNQLRWTDSFDNTKFKARLFGMSFVLLVAVNARQVTQARPKATRWNRMRLLTTNQFLRILLEPAIHFLHKINSRI